MPKAMEVSCFSDRALLIILDVSLHFSFHFCQHVKLKNNN